MAPVVATRDQKLVPAFRALFELTHEQLAKVSGISVRTWERVEHGEVDRERATPAVREVLAAIEEVMGYLDPIPYGQVRDWAARPRGGRGRSPIELVHRPGGLTQLLQELRADGD